jgi:hypothetical protein
MKERGVQHDVRLALGMEPDCVLFRNNVGVAFQRDGSVVRYGLQVGSGDLIGIGPGGRFVSLELKAADGRLSKEQQQWLDLVRRFGGAAVVARGADEARAFLARVRAGENR